MPRQEVLVPSPPDIIEQIDEPIDHGDRTGFLVELARREIRLPQQRQALKGASGSWKSEDHPELAQGSANWIRALRQESKKPGFDMLLDPGYEFPNRYGLRWDASKETAYPGLHYEAAAAL